MALTFRKAVPSERGDAVRVLWSAFTLYVRNLGREITADHYVFSPAIARGDVYFAVTTVRSVGVAATERRDGGIYIDGLAWIRRAKAGGLGASCWSDSRNGKKKKKKKKKKIIKIKPRKKIKKTKKKKKKKKK
jgi:hypothetical protein